MKKSFGQNLLVDENYLNQIIKEVNLNKNDIVLEIGAGSGLLTCLLAKQVQKVIAVEMERSILSKLKSSLQANNVSNVQIVEGNFLKLNLESLVNKPFKVIGNIPYNITSQILFKLFGDFDLPAQHLHLMRDVYLMVQKEVAERIVSKPNSKSYSSLSILIQYFSSPEILFKVPNAAFHPVPKVDSAFVHFDLKKKLELIENPAALIKVIKSAFSQKRKKIVNSLETLGISKEDIVQIFEKLNYDPNLRAENFKFQEYLMLSKFLCKP